LAFAALSTGLAVLALKGSWRWMLSAAVALVLAAFVTLSLMRSSEPFVVENFVVPAYLVALGVASILSFLGRGRTA
jgi:hypothetical protein